MNSTPYVASCFTLTSSVWLITLWSSSTCVDGVATHSVWSIDAVQFKVQATCIADHLAAQIASPDGRRRGAAVCARQILLRALLVVVGAFRAIVVVVLGKVIGASPQMVAGSVGDFTGSCSEWWRSSHDLLACCILESRSTWASLFSTSTSLLLSVLQGNGWITCSISKNNVKSYL